MHRLIKFKHIQHILQRGVEDRARDFLAGAVPSPKRAVAIDATRSPRVHDGARHGRRSLLPLWQVADDGEGKGLQPVGVGGFQVVLDGDRFHRMGCPPVVPVEFEIGQVVGGLVQVTVRRGVAAVAVQDEEAAESASIRGADNVLDGGDQRGDAKTNRAGIFEEIMGEAKVQGRRDQDACAGGGGIGQGEGNADVGQQAEVTVLFTCAEDKHQAVVLREVFFHVHPVQVFEAHKISGGQIGNLSYSKFFLQHL